MMARGISTGAETTVREPSGGALTHDTVMFGREWQQSTRRYRFPSTA